MAAPHYPERLAKLQALLKRRNISVFLVTHPANRRYLSGYTAADHDIQESSGVLLIPARGTPYLLTDSRFTLQAEEEAAGFTVREYAAGLMALLRKLLPELGAARLGFESHYVLHATAGKLVGLAGKLGVELVPQTGLVERLRIVKSEVEIDKIRAAVRLNEEVFARVYPAIKPGMSETAAALALEAAMREMGAESPSFETIVAFGANAAKPHAVPSSATLNRGDLVLVDMGLVLDGYCSDMSRTFVAGRPDPVYTDRHRVVRRAQLAAMETIRAGITCREVDLAARRIIREAGYGDFFGHALGHGVGINVHEAPRLSSRSRGKLRAGMVVTVEPGIYLPGWGGIRLENMVVVRETGCEVLNRDATFLDL
ncbi:MAG: Xaa-Pro peptidase family protein [Desulfobulbaceae bacterium]|jgi:Xaa-Pro aminopeptidase|nr:Xaa-Pro peptidase family protein [Desulfobulbaceae bacterium]